MNLRRWTAFLVLLLLLPLPANAERTITITLAGDCTLGCEEKNRSNDRYFIRYAQREGYEWFFANVRHLFEQDDYTVVNLEGVLSDSPNQENTKKIFRFRGKTDYVNILSDSGIDCVNLANNHTQDFGSQGFDTTLAALKRAGIDHFGGREITVFRKDGIRIAFLGCNCFGTSAIKAFRDDKAWYETCVQTLREDGVNAIVFTFHAGDDYSLKHNALQKECAEFAISIGCDLVVMHSSHVLQGISIINSRYVIWSLGNFCFGGNTELTKDRPSENNAKNKYSYYTAVMQVEMSFDDDGQFLGQQLKVFPALGSSHSAGLKDTYPVNNYQPLLVSGNTAEYILDLIRDDTDSLIIPPYNESAGCAQMPFLPAN